MLIGAREIRVLWLGTLLTINLVRADEDDFDEDEEDFSPMVGQKNDHFDWVLCSTMDHLQPKNIISSPFNIKFMMVLLYEASVKEAAAELASVLQLDNDRKLTRARYGSLIKILQASHPDYELHLKSRLFLDKRFGPKTWYQDVLARDYDTFAERINFGDPDVAADAINKWAKQVTRGAVNNLVTGDGIQGNELLLANAVYFKGLWLNPFPPENSYSGTFTSLQSGGKAARFMTQTDMFYVSESEELDCQFLRLPYKGKMFAMYIALPKKEDGLNNMLVKIRPFLLRGLIWRLEQNMVAVTLPMFKYETTINVKDVMMKMGITSLFSKYDNLVNSLRTKKQGGKGGQGPAHVRVSGIIQKATIDVTETGTVASAITGQKKPSTFEDTKPFPNLLNRNSVRTCACDKTRFVNKIDFQPLIFNASHPFMFFIKNEETGTVIFQGKFVNPDEKTGSVRGPVEPSKQPNRSVYKEPFTPQRSMFI